ncbi:myosuppressin [Diorhabda carinulata]|uniref:myosuppressin n=1 Tax=Diorhabda carinulata TaxID=1163345 RepID=UPI0025A04B3F|nr:myosuppressin [Diorhabda carinulata]
MHLPAMIVSVFGTVLAILLTSVAKASIISCPPSAIQEQMNPSLRQLCFAIEQAVEDMPKQYADRLEERNTNLNDKRQDVDHVFLRFGRRLGL